VTVGTPVPEREPEREPATPPEEVVTLPKAGRDPTTPVVTVVPDGTASPTVNDSLKEKACPAVFTS
jgi:hypothetical protein